MMQMILWLLAISCFATQAVTYIDDISNLIADIKAEHLLRNEQKNYEEILKDYAFVMHDSDITAVDIKIARIQAVLDGEEVTEWS